MSNDIPALNIHADQQMTILPKMLMPAKKPPDWWQLTINNAVSSVSKKKQIPNTDQCWQCGDKCCQTILATTILLLLLLFKVSLMSLILIMVTNENNYCRPWTKQWWWWASVLTRNATNIQEPLAMVRYWFVKASLDANGMLQQWCMLSKKCAWWYYNGEFRWLLMLTGMAAMLYYYYWFCSILWSLRGAKSGTHDLSHYA